MLKLIVVVNMSMDWSGCGCPYACVQRVYRQSRSVTVWDTRELLITALSSSASINCLYLSWCRLDQIVGSYWIRCNKEYNILELSSHKRAEIRYSNENWVVTTIKNGKCEWSNGKQRTGVLAPMWSRSQQHYFFNLLKTWDSAEKEVWMIFGWLNHEFQTGGRMIERNEWIVFVEGFPVLPADQGLWRELLSTLQQTTTRAFRKKGTLRSRRTSTSTYPGLGTVISISTKSDCYYFFSPRVWCDPRVNHSPWLLTKVMGTIQERFKK